MTVDKTSEVPDITDEGDDDDDASARPAVPQIDPKEIAKQTAREILGMQQQQQQTTQQRRESKLQKRVETMIAAGMPKEAIQTVLDLVGDLLADRDAEMSAVSQQQQYANFNAALFARAERALDVFDGKIPKLGTLKPGLVTEMSEMFKNNPELAGGKAYIDKGQMPPDSWFDKAANLAVDDLLDQMGVTKRSAPVQVRSSKPKTKSEPFDPSGLDSENRKLYFAVKNALGEEDARKAVQESQRIRRDY